MLPRAFLPLFSTAAVFTLLLVATRSASAQAKKPLEPALAWHDVQEWGLEGREWIDMPRKRWFARFPDAAESTVDASVWVLSQDSAGMAVRFETDARAIWADYVVSRKELAGYNMAATGASGVDLYARDERGAWRWVGVTKPEKTEIRQPLLEGGPGTMREYLAYLPLRNGVESLRIGVSEGARFTRLAPRAKPVVFYGTSITHGISASRPGMVHTAILGRRLDRAVVNLGFSGFGRMDPEVVAFLVKIDAAAYVIDCLPNLNAAAVRERAPILVKQIRAARPETPILLVEDRRNANAWTLPARDKHHTENHAALREVFAALQKEGVKGLHYLPGDALLGDDAEGTTDGSHPSDLGFMRQAAIFEPVLRELLR